MRLVILGYYGFGNWGDELSLLATVHDIAAISNQRRLPYLCQIIAKDGELSLPFPIPVEIISRKEIPQLFYALRRSDAVIVGGGSLLQDRTSFRSLCYYTLILRLALVFGKPLCFYGCGFGPLQRRLSRSLVSSILRGSSSIVCRDSESEELALALGAKPKRLYRGIDVVFSLADWLKREGLSPFPPEKIAFFLRPFFPGDEGKETVLLEAIRALIARGKAVELVAFHREWDGEVVSRYAHTLGIPWISFASLEEMVRYFQTVGVVFSMRLHPLILATIFGLPWFAFDFDPKMVAFSRFFGEENLLSLDELSPQSLLEKYAIRDTVREKTQALRSEFERLSLQGRMVLAEFLSRLAEKRR